jgi:hypothetical protein
MADVTISIPNPQIPRIRAAFAAAYNYQPTIPDPNNPGQTIPNPVSIDQFVKQQVIRYVKTIVREHEAHIADATARATVETDVEGINIT